MRGWSHVLGHIRRNCLDYGGDCLFYKTHLGLENHGAVEILLCRRAIGFLSACCKDHGRILYSVWDRYDNFAVDIGVIIFACGLQGKGKIYETI